MRTAIYFFYGLDVEIRPKMDPPELFIHPGGAIGMSLRSEGKFTEIFNAGQRRLRRMMTVRSARLLGAGIAADYQ